MTENTKAKEPKVIELRELQKRLHQAELSYGSSIDVTLDEDLNVTPYNRPDLAEETPKESAKRAERQQSDLLDKADENNKVLDRAVFTAPLSSIKEEQAKDRQAS
jgi:hypothetical protein